MTGRTSVLLFSPDVAHNDVMRESFDISTEQRKRMMEYGLDTVSLKGCSVVSYDFGERIISEGKASGRVLIITRGKAKVGLSSPDGSSLILCFYHSTGILGEVELLLDKDDEVDLNTVTALDDFECISIPLSLNREYLLSNPVFVRSCAYELARKLRFSSETVMENTLYSSRTRLCRYILNAEVGGVFRDIMTDTAASVGTSYRHLYRMMEELVKEGILEKRPSGYRILDYSRLRELGGI